MRLFTGITVPDEVIQKAKKFEELNEKVQGVRWTREENLHITTCFYGQVERHHLGDFSDQMEKIAENQRAFTLKAEEILTFPEERPYMAWLKFKESKPFADLCDSLADISGQPEERVQIPHVTLARFDSHLTARHFKLEVDVEEIQIPVREFHLFESILLPNGPEYRKIRTFEI